jgi:lysophospholipase
MRMTFDRRSIPANSRFSVVRATDGWALRVYEQSAVAPPCGSILWLGGRGDIVEKYLETLDAWSRAGWEITSFDWRGQGGSGRMGGNRHVGHIDDYAIWVEDLAAFFAEWAARSPGPHVVMGHSMGGHLVLRALAEKRIAPDKVVLVAPMLGFETGILPFSVTNIAVQVMAWASSELKPAWKHNEKPSPPNASRQAYLTHDIDRYADELWWKEKDPSLTLGPPSWRWLSAAYKSIALLNRPGTVEHISVPMLILCAEHDQLVSAKAIHGFAARLPTAVLVTFGAESAHEILREADGPRNRALAAIAEFLE